MKRLLRDQSGSTVPIFAVILAVGTILLGGVVNGGLAFLEDRRLQALTDMIALVSVRDDDHSTQLAFNVIADQGRDPSLFDPVLVPGHYRPDPDLAPGDRFTAGMRPFNAVRVFLHAAVEGEERGVLLARASAAREDRISFSIGSRLVRVEDGLSGAVLESLLGLDSAITVADYNALAGIRIDSARFLRELEQVSGTQIGRSDELLRLELPPQSVIEAVVRSAASDTEHDVLRRLSRRMALPAHRIGLGDVLSADPRLEGLLSPGQAGVRLSALDLMMASALVANGQRQLDLAVDARLAAIRLLVGEHPQSPPVDSAAGPGSRAETRQIALDVATRNGLSLIDARVEAARAEAVVSRVTCRGRTDVEAEFIVQTSPARLVLEGSGPLSRPIVVDLGSGSRQTVRMNRSHIDSGQPVRVTGGAGFDTSLTGVGSLAGPIVTRVGEVLQGAGINVAEADLFLRDARCGHAFLVE